MASTNQQSINADLYKLKLNAKLSEYDRNLKAYEQSRSKIVSLQSATKKNIVFIKNKTIQGTPSITTNKSTKELCKSTITGQYKAARYDKNKNCGLFTTDAPRVVNSNDSQNFVIIDELYSEKINFNNLNNQLRAKCEDLIYILRSPEYAKIYGDIMQNNSKFLNELTRMSKQLEADRNEINKKTGLTLSQEMYELEETNKMSKLKTDSNYYISSLLMFVLVVIVLGGIYLMVPSSTNGVIQTGGGKLSKQSYFMIATLVLASIIIYQLRIYRS